MATIFICDDEIDMLRYLSKLLKASGYQVETFQQGSELLSRLESDDGQDCDVLLQDVRMPDIHGLEMLKRVRKQFPELPIIIMTAHGTVDDAVSAIKQGAYDYIMKPFPREKLLGTLERVLDHHRLVQENRQLREELQLGNGVGDTIIFRSAAFRDVCDLTLQVAESDANVLITGESGAGKELIARALHRNSPRSGKPFVSLNCATLSDTLLESQLFGHVRGAFTGAVMNQKGLLREADGGTLFLDEIGDISPMVQSKLLRVTQEKDFIVLGTTHARKVDVRFLAATNRDLMADVRAGRFREDLYYRINVISINVPPLRERREDIEPLALHFMETAARRMKKDVREIDGSAFEALKRYDWPGNVRELKNVIERALILARDSTITAAMLPLVAARKETTELREATTDLIELSEMERRHISAVFRETGFHKGRTIAILGISRKTLDRKIAEYGLSDSLQQ